MIEDNQPGGEAAKELNLMRMLICFFASFAIARVICNVRETFAAKCRLSLIQIASVAEAIHGGCHPHAD